MGSNIGNLGIILHTNIGNFGAYLDTNNRNAASLNTNFRRHRKLSRSNIGNDDVILVTYINIYTDKMDCQYCNITELSRDHPWLNTGIFIGGLRSNIESNKESK